MTKAPIKIFPGNPAPLGHSFDGDQHNFAVFSDRKLPLTLVIYLSNNHTVPLFEIPMEESQEIFHIAVSNLPHEYIYTYRVDAHEVFDPYAKEVTSSAVWGEASLFIRSYPTLDQPFDWEGIQKPYLPFESLIIYETHVRGFTAKDATLSELRGTYQGFVNKIDYLKYLGVNAVELLPVHLSEETDTPFPFSPTGNILCNYWGYNTLSFFEPKRSYSKQGISPTIGFKYLVRELHRAGIEVILDVVYNHVSLKSPLFYLAPNSYFLMKPDGEHTNYTGCGNTINSNHPQSMNLILSSLRYWAEEMQVDGFRFDLASIFCRGDHGQALENPPILEAIAKDPILSKVKLIAEPWDADGLYQVGSFPSPLFAEWNGHYRDTVRQFIKGDAEKKDPFIQSMIGSKNIYEGKKSPFHSINFITCHDGFTLMDLLSYNGKKNEENGENNQDGSNGNYSWNCGIEGLTQDPSVLRLREKQFCNYMTVLFLSQGTPMLLMGDEVGQTHYGNNNAYCQDQSWNWFSWTDLKKNKARFLFVQKLICLRKSLPFLATTSYIKNEDLQIYNESIVKDHLGFERFVSFQILNTLFFAFNANNFPVELTLPPCKQNHIWKMLIYTTNPIKTAIFDKGQEPKIQGPITLDPYTSLVAMQTPL